MDISECLFNMGDEMFSLESPLMKDFLSFTGDFIAGSGLEDVEISKEGSINVGTSSRILTLTRRESQNP